jgi:hypothetical protein
MSPLPERVGPAPGFSKAGRLGRRASELQIGGRESQIGN